MSGTLEPLENTNHILDELRECLAQFSTEVANPELRERVRALIPSFHKLRELGVSLMPEYAGIGAKDRILAYFKRFPMTIIDGDELMVVSGIGEWARRIRELRREEGWLINSGVTFIEIAQDQKIEGELTYLADLAHDLGRDPLSLKPDEYVLLAEEPDREAAHRWKTLNKIRRLKIGVREKILLYLQESVGHPVSGEELRYVANKSKEWARRTRELRTQDGWPVVTKQSGRPDLPVGVYLLEENKQAQPHDRNIPDKVRVAVLKRDNYCCAFCGWPNSGTSPGDPRHRLELHHVIAHKDKGGNSADNLLTLCNVDHDIVHADDGMGQKAEQILKERTIQ